MLGCASLPAQEAEPKSPQQIGLERAQAAVKSQDWEQATFHLDDALWFAPFDADILQERLRLAALQEEPDQQALWGMRLAWASANARGTYKASRAIKNLHYLKGKDKALVQIPKAYATAGRSLLRAAEKLPSHESLSQGMQYLNVMRLLVEDFPALSDELLPRMLAAVERCRPSPRSVLEDTLEVAERAYSEQQYGRALIGARWVHGVAVQAGFKELEETAPDLSDIKGAAGGLMARARLRMREGEESVYSLDQIAAYDLKERADINELHESWADPAISYSPKNLYRVETVCGLSTLELTADCVENHHRRLLRWFGRDPFDGRQGLIRVVPHSQGLESEGAGFYWVGGFQGGDTTTVAFTMGNRGGMGRLLTHELTHRFDGAMYPHGLGAWLVEGKAVYTGGAYNHEEDLDFLEHYFSRGSVYPTLNKGYASRADFVKLLRGEIEEYRDNYSAGHALFTYLYTWIPPQDTEHLYRKQLYRYMENKAEGKPEVWFARHFADGQDGRPKSLEDFLDAYREWLLAFTENEPPDWVHDYQTSSGDGGPRVYDKKIWPNRRHRIPPTLGEYHAGTAGDYLVEMGEKEAAIRAYEWARSCQDLNQEQQAQLAQLYRERDIRFSPVAAKEIQRVIELLGQIANQYASAGLQTAAQDLWGRAQQLARRSGLGPASVPEELSIQGQSQACNRAAHLARFGWAVSDLGDTESTGPWYYQRDDLVLGRGRKDGAETQQERAVYQRPVFVHAGQRLQGPYSLKVKVAPLTTYIDLSLIIGFEGGNRYSYFRTTFGDYAYSAGYDQVDEIHGVRVQYGDNRIRDSALWGSGQSFEIPFERTRNSETTFELEVVVDGASAVLYFDGQLVAYLRHADGVDFGGLVGFQVSRGAVRLHRPSFQRHRRTPGKVHCACTFWPEDWNPLRATSWSWETLVGRKAEGLDPGLHGTLLAWVPTTGMPEDMTREDADEIARYQAFAGVRPAEDFPEEFPRRWMVAFPHELYDLVNWDEPLETREPVVRYFSHPYHSGLDLWVERSRNEVLSEQRRIRGSPEDVLIYIDRDGIIRAVDAADHVVEWIRVQQGY